MQNECKRMLLIIQSLIHSKPNKTIAPSSVEFALSVYTRYGNSYNGMNEKIARVEAVKSWKRTHRQKCFCVIHFSRLPDVSGVS